MCWDVPIRWHGRRNDGRLGICGLADGYLDKKGELSFEQILFCRSLETMALCAELVGDANGKQKYEKLAAALKAKLEPAFWNNQKQAFVHNCVNGQQSDAVTRYANMFLSSFNI